MLEIMDNDMPFEFEYLLSIAKKQSILAALSGVLEICLKIKFKKAGIFFE